jgi:LuxR family quorum sensing-dependent transcriptional regulator
VDQVVAGKPTFFGQETRNKLIDYSMEVESLSTIDKVLNQLHDIVSEKNPLRVLGANRFPAKLHDRPTLEFGKNIFFHKDVPRGWLEEWAAYVESGYPSGLMIARICIAPFTWTELLRMLDPVGIDRLPFELALKYGMRDGFLCPVGGRWIVAFWTQKLLDERFTHQARGLLCMAASAAAIRLERLVGPDPKRVGSHALLTPRERSVLRHASMGESLQETANALGLGVETVRSHLKKAQTKLGTRNRLHTVAEAMRDLLII